MNGINLIRVNNPQITFKAERVVYPNEFVFDDLEEKKPNFDFLNIEEKTAPAVPKKEPLFKRISKNCSDFFNGVNKYYRYRNGVKLAVKTKVITKERAKEILNEQKTILFNILKK